MATMGRDSWDEESSRQPSWATINDLKPSAWDQLQSWPLPGFGAEQLGELKADDQNQMTVAAELMCELLSGSSILAMRKE
jgi:hypothetical protein